MNGTLGGPHAWALRLKRLLTSRPVYVVCHGPPGGLIVQPDFAYSEPAELLRWLSSVAPAIVMPNWIWEAYDACEVLRRRGADLRVVAFCRSDSEHNYYAPLVARHHQYDWLVAVSETCAAVLRDRLPHKTQRIRLLRTFVERGEVLRRVWQARPVRLLYSGRVEHEDKRVLDLLPLVGGLLRAGVPFTLTVAGTGSQLGRLLDGLEGRPHAGSVRLVGQIAPAQMPTLYAEHDVLIQPSSTEGLSNALLEAMAAGLVPIVTRTRSGIAGVVTHDVNAITVRVGDVEAMISAVALLSASASVLEQMGRAAHAATEDYSWTRYSSRFERLLAEVQAPDMSRSA